MCAQDIILVSWIASLASSNGLWCSKTHCQRKATLVYDGIAISRALVWWRVEIWGEDLRAMHVNCIYSISFDVYFCPRVLVCGGGICHCIREQSMDEVVFVYIVYCFEPSVPSMPCVSDAKYEAWSSVLGQWRSGEGLCVSSWLCVCGCVCLKVWVNFHRDCGWRRRFRWQRRRRRHISQTTRRFSTKHAYTNVIALPLRRRRTHFRREHANVRACVCVWSSSSD